MREPLKDYAQTDQRLPVTQRRKHVDTGVQYSATMNVRDLPSRMRTSLICTVASDKYDRKYDCDLYSRRSPIAKESCDLCA